MLAATALRTRVATTRIRALAITTRSIVNTTIRRRFPHRNTENRVGPLSYRSDPANMSPSAFAWRSALGNSWPVLATGFSCRWQPRRRDIKGNAPMFACAGCSRCTKRLTRWASVMGGRAQGEKTSGSRRPRLAPDALSRRRARSRYRWGRQMSAPRSRRISPTRWHPRIRGSIVPMIQPVLAPISTCPCRLGVLPKAQHKPSISETAS